MVMGSTPGKVANRYQLATIAVGDCLWTGKRTNNQRQLSLPSPWGK